MSTLTIRSLDETVKQKLRVQAASHGRSMEAEARAIITQAVKSDGNADNLAQTPQDRMRERLASIRGTLNWPGTTDELMRELRGDD